MARMIWRAFYRDEKKGGFFAEEYEVAAAPTKAALVEVLKKSYPKLRFATKRKRMLGGTVYVYWEDAEFNANPITLRQTVA